MGPTKEAFLHSRNDTWQLNLSLLTLLELASAYLFAHSIPAGHQPWAVGFLVLLVVLTYFWRPLQSFILLAVGALASSFVYVWLAWSEGNASQLQLIWQQVILIVLGTVTWGLGVYVRGFVEQVETLRARTAELEKFSPQTRLLTLNEFTSEARMAFAIAKRRDEHNVLVWLTLRGFASEGTGSRTSAHLMSMLSEAVLASLRSNIDIAGYLPPGTALILLQNTDENGARIVVDRIMGTLRKEPSLHAETLAQDIAVQVTPLDHDFAAFESALQKGPESA